MSWYLAVMKNYTGFRGRARRREYWMFVLVNAIIGVPKEVARPHLQDPELRGGARGGIGLTEAVLDANAALSERAAASRRCPKCESDHYKQRTIRP
jgi:hypothetical protein